MPRKGTYVDNAANRRLGRVGMAYGTAVQSKSSGGGGSSRSSMSSFTAGACAYVGVSFQQTSRQSSAQPVKTYVDNAQNRALGRVGLPHGTAVHSKHDSAPSSSSSRCSEKSVKTYVDNAQNRALGRVGLPHGTAVHSKCDSAPSCSSSQSSANSVKTYVDNPQNRALGRVGLPHGTAVHSKGERKVYKDNAFNRRLNRVGLPLGAKPFHKNRNKTDSTVEEAAAAHGAEKEVKVYKDNPYNRKHGRVGKPLGSMPISRKNEVYRDNEINRRLGRVGLPWGSCPVDKNILAWIRRRLDEEQIGVDDDLPDDIGEMYEQASPDMRDQIEYAKEFHDRERAVTAWLDEADNVNWDPHQRTSVETIAKYSGKILNFMDLDLRERIGHGSFGEVYAAVLDDEFVAVKKLLVQHLTRKHIQKFAEEVQIFCDLSHENVVRFIGVCTEAPDLAIVMEYMDMSLFDAIHINEVEFDNSSAKKVIQDMARGLAYLHSESVAHCDIKSQNALLSNVPGQKGTDPHYPILAKITDFGLSKLKSNTDTSTSDTMRVRGTPKYAAPEVLRGEMLGTAELMAADVYSFGLVIYEMAVQEIPFEDLNLTQMIEQVGRKGLSPMAKCYLNLNPYVRTKLNECFNFEANKRPTAQDMVEMAENMSSLLNEEEE